jgi:hypothetical protein
MFHVLGGVNIAKLCECCMIINSEERQLSAICIFVLSKTLRAVKYECHPPAYVPCKGKLGCLRH